MNKALALAILGLIHLAAYPGTPVLNTTLVNGYERKVSGEDFTYYSSIPVARESMLIRATDGNYSMQWATAAVPSNIKTEQVSFVWLAGIGSSPGDAAIQIEVEGHSGFSFHTDGSANWSLQSKEGASLCFRSDLTDQHGDHFGFMYLTFPAQALHPGERLIIKATGGHYNKNSWYMTFKFPIQDSLSIKTMPAIAVHGGHEYQLAVAGLMYFGDSAMAKIQVNGTTLKTYPIHFGYNYIKLEMPAVQQAETVHYELQAGELRQSGKLELFPVKHWKVDFVQHSHTDIGYTRSQTDILTEHLRYIDYALDYCDLTDSYPDEAKFRWTCEASWAVDEYLRCRPASQISRLKQRIAEGRIEVTGMYFNFDELPDEQVLTSSLAAMKRIRETGIEVRTAMQDDVNGIGWGLCDYFSGARVKYLNMGTHGHRALICFDKPTLFWWESPSGHRMLAFRAEHYMTGNTVFKIHGTDFNVFEDELLTYLQQLDAKGYPYDEISIQHSGYQVDNSPPSTRASDMILQWNEKYSWPKLRTITPKTFFENMESRYADQFPVIRAAWPDWWTDGFGGSAREVAATRNAQNQFISNTSALTMAALAGNPLPDDLSQRIGDAQNALLFYSEHTLGYHASVREPFHTYTMEQRALKESYAWEAARRSRMLGEDGMGLLQSTLQRGKKPILAVYNTLNWPRSGLVKVYIDHQLLPRYTSFTLTDAQGNTAPAQGSEHFSDGSYYMVWVTDVPAFGFKTYQLDVSDIPLASPVHYPPNRHRFENKWYSIDVDTTTGAIISLYDKKLSHEWVDPTAPWQLGQFVYEQLDNRTQLEAHRLDNFTRKGLDKAWIDAFEHGEVWDCVRLKGNTDAAYADGDYSVEIRLFKTCPRIDLAYYLNKKLETKPEGIYISFPFQLAGGKLSFDVAGGEVQAGVDQIPGSANDWNTVQHYARLHNGQCQLMVSSVENPLMQFGNINTGRYKAGATPESTRFYGWPMNNYWTTNFNADQHGGHQWVYTISTSADTGVGEAIRFGWGRSLPFPVRMIPGGGATSNLPQGSYLQGWQPNLLLISAVPQADGHSALVHLRETSGIASTIHLAAAGKNLKVTATDVTGVPLSQQNLEIGPLESRFFLLEW